MSKVLSKLAFRNAKRSSKDYIIYIITVTLAFSLIFSFNMLIFSKDILGLSEMMKNFTVSIIFVSIIIIFVIGWLINYTTKFIFEKRSKEFGTYLILGIDKKQVTKMFLLENVILGICALILSFFLGIFLSMFMVALIMNIFELPFKVSFQASPPSILLTLLYFAIIYTFVLIRSKCRIKKMKVYDLLYYDKKNENKMYKNRKSQNGIFLLSIIIGIVSLGVFHWQFGIGDNMSFPILLATIIGLIISIYGLTFTISSFSLQYVLKRSKVKYSKDNLFVARQFSSKVRSMGFTLGTLSLLVTLTFLSLNISHMFQRVFNNQVRMSAPYDISIMNGGNDDDFDKYLSFLKKKVSIEKRVQYKIYTDNTNQIRKDIPGGILGYQKVDCYIRVSDYNILLAMLGEDKITLKKDQYYIHSYQDVMEDLEKRLNKNPTITIQGKKRTNKALRGTGYASAWSPGSSYIIVVPDELVKGMEVVNTALHINTKEKTTEKLLQEMKKSIVPHLYKNENDDGNVTYYSIENITVKGAVEAENKTFLTIISFSLMYLAFIFTAVVGTVLAIQSLSDSSKYRFRYIVLHKLGVEEQALYKTIRKQLLIYFLLPLLYPILISIATSISMYQLFGALLNGQMEIVMDVVFGTGLFLFVYILYLVATYFGFKNNIKEDL